MTKQELRQSIKADIRQMQQSERIAASQDICQQITGSPEWQEADTVLLYAALPDEVDLSPLMEEAERGGKRVLLPVVDGDNLQIRAYDPGHMALGEKYSIMEPTEECPVIDNLDEISLALIPGRAFTREGWRMGRGKGYYDRLLTSLHCPRWGVAFACQIVSEVPTDPWDIKLDRVVANVTLPQ